ncbi:hypothetical protein BOSE62_110345 [Bosea sp. 62]|uniref:integrase core domain-containing protein n=1 Tax=unclassified Bosea (in: a-proteobacteria) TaxID=2653178 RepID=UPI0012F4084B|nr:MULTISPECIES: integrase core domain-containing protein [unclassified Bosea (in: a-proteobacteria)]CAD5285585.1 hypothetical protein BOSE21B_50244 [Bosea sp. 21B]CAD5288263.1 hypothetical protein BOSE46_70235 [Bosea sp. 46]CAD5301458.1 hypothetical protein BOSE7B_90444 [Bosea sp. 7B]VXB08573.1 hypothetical protein BOSE62_110345 [Bosea sp. 62]VXC58010.1 hypothetical protein BOSE29B_50235 [Bosea sp. 29B]
MKDSKFSDAQKAFILMEAWLSYYNEDRPHGVIGNKPPILLQNPGGTPSPPP